jgi:DNA-binding protein H-NS
MNETMIETLKTFSSDELMEIRNHINILLEDKTKDKIKSILEDMEQWGIKPSDLNGHAKENKEHKKIAPKYRNPDNPSQTWTGKGITVKWLKELMEDRGISEVEAKKLCEIS